MITAIVLTKNEEKNIKACLDSLSWCDEVMVIDDESSDKTREIAEHSGATVYMRSLKNDFANQRNFGLEKATNEWVLFIDADERVPLSLNYEILSIINNPIDAGVGYKIRRIDTMWGRQLSHGETGSASFLRLAKKAGGKWNGEVHEVWQVKGTTKTVKNAILHYPHQSVTEFLTEINTYTDIRAQELYEKKKRYPVVMIAIYPVSKFIVNFFLKRGFQDGIPGLVIALMMSFHSFLVRGKLWQLWINRR